MLSRDPSITARSSNLVPFWDEVKNKLFDPRSEPVLTNMVTLENSRFATYLCSHCLTPRPWGSGRETIYPLPNCVTCKTTTRHEFFAVNEYTATLEVIGAEENI